MGHESVKVIRVGDLPLTSVDESGVLAERNKKTSSTLQAFASHYMFRGWRNSHDCFYFNNANYWLKSSSGEGYAFKRRVCPKMNILSLFTRPHIIPNQTYAVFSIKQKGKLLY